MSDWRAWKGKVGLRLSIGVAVVALLLLQWSLWGDRGIVGWYLLDQKNQQMRAENDELMKRNASLVPKIEDLKTGVGVLEEKAREDLGMVKPGETFFRIIDAPDEKEKDPGKNQGESQQ